MRQVFIGILLGLFLAGSVHAELGQPVNGSQLFFDDFVSSEFPVQWITTFGNAGNITQQGGYLTMTMQSSVFQTVGQNNLVIFGNGTGGPGMFNMFSRTDPATEFRQIVFRVQAMNVSNPVVVSSGHNVQVYSETSIGLGSPRCSIKVCSVFFNIWSSNGPLSNLDSSKFPVAKQAIFLSITGIGNDTITNTFSSCGNPFGCAFGGPGDKPGLLYSTTIDVNAVHVYRLQVQMDKLNDANDYVRGQVDSNGWMQLNDVACGCIMPQSTGGNVLPDLYPFIAASYSTKASPPLTVNQSEAVSIDYVLVTDYPPAVLPTGQLLSSNINPPTHNQGIYQPGGFSLTQYIQFEAWQIGQGNIYAGGLFMTGIFLLIITAGLGGVFLKLKLGMSIFGMIWNISTLAFVYLMFFTGVLPLMVPILVSIGAAAIFFGIFRSGPPASGGEITG